MNFQNILNSIFRREKRDAIHKHGLQTLRVTAANMRDSIITHYLGNKRAAVITREISVFKRIAVNSQNLRFPAVTGLKQGTSIFLSALVLVSIVSCKKDKGIQNLEWQNESLSLTAEICAKYRDCADKEWKSIPENLKKFTEGRLDEAQCQKRFRESNAYKLVGADPFAIQTAYKECHSQVLKFSCEDLKEEKIETVPSCVAFQKVQNGK